MNKKETAAFDQLQHELRLAKAFNRTPAVAPDLAPPSDGSQPISKGYLYHVHSTSVDKACSDRTRHYRGGHELPDYGLARSSAVALYSTKLRALQALRHEVEKDVAARLATIDKQIEHELALDASPNGT